MVRLVMNALQGMESALIRIGHLSEKLIGEDFPSVSSSRIVSMRSLQLNRRRFPLCFFFSNRLYEKSAAPVAIVLFTAHKGYTICYAVSSCSRNKRVDTGMLLNAWRPCCLPALKHAPKQIKGDKREKHPRHIPHAEAAPVDTWERSCKMASAQPPRRPSPFFPSAQLQSKQFRPQKSYSSSLQKQQHFESSSFD